MADAVRTLARENDHDFWNESVQSAPANYTQYELIFQYLRVAAGIVKRNTAVGCRHSHPAPISPQSDPLELMHRSSKSIPLASGRLAIVCMLANTPRYGVG